MKSKGFAWIVSNTKFAVWSILVLSLLGIAVSYLDMHFAFASKTVMDIATGAISGTLMNAVVVLCILILLQIGAHIIYTLIEVRLRCGLINKIQNKVFRNILESDYLNVTSYHSGELVNRLENDVSVIAGCVTSLMPNLCMLIARAVFSFGALYILDRRFALLCIVILPFVTIAGRIYGKRMKKLHKDCSTAGGRVLSYMQEAIRNILVVKAFVKEQLTATRLGQLQDDSMKLNVKREIISLFANLLFFAVMTFGYYCALVWCAYNISIGLMTVGTLTAILQLFDQLQSPFGELSTVIPRVYRMIASAERIIELEEISEDKEGQTLLCDDFQCVRLDNVSFSYEDSGEIIQNFSHSFNKGELAVVGGLSGIGKSTLMKLIMGILIPSEGKVVICDGDEEYICNASTRHNFAYVPQGNMIMSGTLRQNVTFFDDSVTDDAVIAACSDACIYDYITSLPLGLDTILGEGGAGMSEGQVQRIAIARALCTGASVILLDEATSALDEETEYRVLTNIKNSGRTCIAISHKQCAFDLSDSIITL